MQGLIVRKVRTRTASAQFRLLGRGHSVIELADGPAKTEPPGSTNHQGEQATEPSGAY
ncbi:hypothetical protein BCh11DRAFT_07239 [Burkholderia sp. Ch1-1]|nr:hypothetical protein BCh11DRAFT_07239 [Burkholderia sp. Ch1-1]